MKTERKMVEGLTHRWGAKDEEFFDQIDELGGWPIGYQYVGFEHTDSRAAGFCNAPNNTGWWTILASSDDYFLWKLSPEALQRIADAVRGSIVLSRPAAHAIFIKNSRGHRAVVQKPEATS